MKIKTRFRVLARTVIYLTVAAIVLAACSSNSSNGSVTTSSQTNSATKTSYSLMTKSSPFGTIIVNSSSITLYMLTADSPSKSVCNGGCLSIWPPVAYSSTIKVQSPLKQSLVGEITRSNGSKQLTYNGHPLYTYSGDSNSGQYNGQRLSFPAGSSSPTGHWYVIGVNGSPITSSSTSGNSGGYSYG
jgi:predicted lipoprotein with Yx(FWY)xxD motif